MHIRTLGDWTSELRSLFGKVSLRQEDKDCLLLKQNDTDCKNKLLNLVFMQACEAQVTSKKATLTRLETTVVADAQTEDTRCLASNFLHSRFDCFRGY